MATPDALNISGDMGNTVPAPVNTVDNVSSVAPSATSAGVSHASSQPIMDSAPSVAEIDALTTKVYHAILSGMLSGDVTSASMLAELDNTRAVIMRLIMTIPPNLGITIDANA